MRYASTSLCCTAIRRIRYQLIQSPKKWYLKSGGPGSVNGGVFFGTKPSGSVSYYEELIRAYNIFLHVNLLWEVVRIFCNKIFPWIWDIAFTNNLNCWNLLDIYIWMAKLFYIQVLSVLFTSMGALVYALFIGGLILFGGPVGFCCGFLLLLIM